MPKGVFPTGQFTCDEVSSKSTGNWGGENLGNQNDLFGGVEWGPSDFDPFATGIGFFQAQQSITEPGLAMPDYLIDQQLEQVMDFGSFNDLYLDVVSPPFQSFEFDDDYGRKLVSSESQNSPKRLPSGSLEILKSYGSRCRRLNNDKANSPSFEIQYTNTNSSAPTIIQLAAEKFIESSSQYRDELSMLNHQHPSSVLANSAALDSNKEVHLVQNLLSSAEKVGEKQYEHAIKLLRECEKMSSNRGSPVQRLIFYFTEALYERIDRETGRITPKGLGKKTADPLDALKCQDSTLVALHQMPLSQIIKFAGIQALVEHVAEARKVHIIDLEIRYGVHCIILMQALSTRLEIPIEHLKITVVGTKSEEKVEETGRRLTSFAESLNFPFSFYSVMIKDILDLNKDLFKLDDDETVTIYAAHTLTTMIGFPERLEHMMRVIKTMTPRVMILTEIEANCNSPIFVDRFVETLFYYSAFFDFLADCMKDDDKNRRDAESTLLSSAIRNIVAAEGKERKIRHVNISVWRAFLHVLGWLR